MPKIDIRIELADAEVSIGGFVSGDVVVVVYEYMAPEKTRISWGFQTRAGGAGQWHDVDASIVAGKGWPAGHRQRLPFRFRVPGAGPLTAEGPDSSLEWFVRAVVQVKADADAAAEARVVVRSLPEPSARRLLSESAQTPGLRPPSIGRCPGCKGPLATARGYGDQACLKCQGTFFSTDAFAQLSSDLLSLALEDLKALVSAGAATTRCCASCGASMTRVAVNETSIELCGSCGAAYFDRGELHRLKIRVVATSRRS
jgi:hypothetical protein